MRRLTSLDASHYWLRPLSGRERYMLELALYQHDVANLCARGARAAPKTTARYSRTLGQAQSLRTFVCTWS